MLFLAIAVQGHLYESVLKAPGQVSRWIFRQARKPSAGPAILIPWTAYWIALLVAFLILAYGIEGESLAIMSLYRWRVVGSAGQPETAVIGLTVIAAAIPAIGFLRFTVSGFKEAFPRSPRKIVADSGGSPPGPGSPPEAQPRLEAGLPDSARPQDGSGRDGPLAKQHEPGAT